MLALLFLALISLSSARVVTLSTSKSGSNVTTAFLDPFAALANASKFMSDEIRKQILKDALDSDTGYDFLLVNCRTNPVSSVATCEGGILFYSYYVEYNTTDDSEHPERVGTWIAEEYGWATIVPPLSSYRLLVSSCVAYYNPKDLSEYELFHPYSSAICGNSNFDPSDMSLIVLGNMTSLCSVGNYTSIGETWLVNMTFKSMR